ncbi:MAG TPA: MarR family transcriptional regulator [Anaerolineae bacterium]|nr:MarR family transcriptional regulator [Anaerolineae bacterium]
MTEDTLSESACHQLAQICRINRGIMHNLVSGLGLHESQPYLLKALWEQDGLTHSELAEWLHVSAATVSNTVKRMEKAGFVERRHDPEDERVSRVYLTEAGRDIQEQVKRMWREFEKQMFVGFSAEELATLETFLARISDNLLALSCSDLLECIHDL